MNTYTRYRFPPDIINYAVWLYYGNSGVNVHNRLLPSGQVNLSIPTAELINDKQEIEKWGGDVPNNKVLVRVHLKKVFPHCGKAIGKADLWNHESWQNEASDNVPGLLDMAKGMASARREDCDRD